MRSSKLKGAVFDLDGVITRTAKVHSRAWKQSFDRFLESYAKRTGTPQRPFDEVKDYLAHVDGKPRHDGVADFLASRSIDAQPSEIDAVAKEKNSFYLSLVDQMGVEVFESSVSLIRILRDAGVPIAVASSSRNCAKILEVAGITEFFDTRVDGNDLSELGLPGKPAPDLFLEAAKRLGVDPRQSAVFEDATSGVEAGRRADYGLVIGVAREGNREELVAAGAHYVVSDLAELDPTELLHARISPLEQE